MAKSNVLQMGKYQRQQVFSLLANLCFEPLDPEFARQGVPEVPHNRFPKWASIASHRGSWSLEGCLQRRVSCAR